MTMTFNHLLTMASNHPLSRPSKTDLSQPQQFDYGDIDNETKFTVEQRTSEIKSLIRQTAQDIVSIGQKLTEVKEKLKHGNFRNWLKAEFNWSLSSATKFMQVSEQFRDVNFANLNFSTSALYILAAPSTPEEARHQALQLASHGEQITYSLAKLIVNRYKCICDSQEREVDTKNRLKMNLKQQSSMPTVNVSAQDVSAQDVSSQTAVNEAILERNSSKKTEDTSLYDDKPDRSIFESDRLQNFKITYAGIDFTIEGKPQEITALFEQMQSDPVFAKEIFTKAQLLLKSKSQTDLKTTKS